jgi:hypothetical protein
MKISLFVGVAYRTVYGKILDVKKDIISIT